MIDHFFQKIALPVIFIASVLVLFLVSSSANNTSAENNAYVRVINCIISINAVDREQGDIENCYQVVEKDLGVTLKRYDNSLR
jgi:hypothetical protein